MLHFKAKDYMVGEDRIHVFKSRYAHKVEKHTHDFIEIVYVTSGRIRQNINGTIYTARRGDLLFMNLGCVHSFECAEKGGFVNILFSPGSIEGGFVGGNALALLALSSFNEMRSEADFGRISFFGKERDAVETLVLGMLAEHDEKKTGWQTVLGNSLGTLLTYMLRKMQEGLDEAEVDEMWQDLAAYIDNHLENKLSLAELAQKCFYNPSYFSRMFKETFGTTFVEYVTKRRVEAAVRLLTETEISVDEISRRVGFADRSSFYHAFSRYATGTPLDYRRGVEKNEKDPEKKSKNQT